MLERLTKIIRENTGDNSITITENTVLISDLGLSSLDLVNLACAVEDEFDIEIPDRAIRTFKTVGDVMVFIKEQ
ncbi:MAG: acyl carrier protein [Anaerolineaceae bacterium]|nr:acyl carrier protein [Anaerolineaceae bacterium]